MHPNSGIKIYIIKAGKSPLPRIIKLLAGHKIIISVSCQGNASRFFRMW